MRPETLDCLAKAHESLDEARRIAAIGLPKAAARSAYYAIFHAAQALIVEQTGRIAKTDMGVRSEFARLAKATQDIGREFTATLAQGYKFKEIGDYAIGPGAVITEVEAQGALDAAERFVDGIAVRLGANSSTSPE